uniref:LAGLIDADG homing endonuclease n=1 Tax=Panagrolaimus sp. PS1159 TaxID=55785 RepID=A0AC35ETU8_9BILA
MKNVSKRPLPLLLESHNCNFFPIILPYFFQLPFLLFSYPKIPFFTDTGSDQYEVCTWRFYSADGEKRAEISCASIVYTPDRKQTKVDFPEARIYEEALNALLRHCGVATYKEMPTKKDGFVM